VQLELALINLAVNARDAMPKGGRFTVSTRPARERGMLELCVRDTGEGMSEDVAARAMEPFFTTKGEGKGTGLGLAQVHAVAVQSGGSVRINTAAGRGTEFVISLPACRAEETHAAPRPGETPARAEP
jgi:signal transduction histidine kinase